ncbi:hypothetical protein HOH87_01265, partial [bacterium]|nr:hypothetical protein [bacterium]
MSLPTTPDADSLAKLDELLSLRDSKWVITVHMDPDYDAIGSALAMSHVLDQKRIQHVVWIADNISHGYNFLPGRDRIVNKIPKDYNYTHIMTLDCTHINRVKEFETLRTDVPLINIDHHADNSHYGSFNIVCRISSVGELVGTFCNKLNWPLSRDIAVNLYAAIIFDTGQFKYNNTTSDTLKMGAQLMEFDIPHNQISYNIFDDKSDNYFELVKIALNNLHLNKELGFAIATIPNCPPHEGHDIIDFVRQIGAAEVVGVIREMAPKKIKVSMR